MTHFEEIHITLSVLFLLS